MRANFWVGVLFYAKGAVYTRPWEWVVHWHRAVFTVEGVHFVVKFDVFGSVR